jgi:hypothetical protein
MSGSLSIAAFRRLAIASVTSFSRVPWRPRAPGSSPPCPASIATITRRSLTGGAPRRASAGCAGLPGSLGGSSRTTGSSGGAGTTGAAPISAIASGRGATSASNGSAGLVG